MKFVLLALLIVGSLSIRVNQPSHNIVVEEIEPLEAFTEYQVKFNKKYHPDEFVTRLENFKTSLARIATRNRAEPEAVFGLTKFSDMSEHEFKTKMLTYRRGPRPPTYTVLRSHPTAKAADVDWRHKGAITAVKDQGECGSCWAFSATEETESMWFLRNRTLHTLAPQQVVSCDRVDDACNGGDTITAYAYIKSAHGIVPEVDYPYTSGTTEQRGRCHFDASKVIAPLHAFVYATPPCEAGACNNQDMTKMESALTSTGPISICVYADSWQDYQSGTLRSNCPHDANSLDHCVQVVGMASDYWIIRNSWNTDWGINGYIQVAKSNNLCGVLDEATIVTFA